MQAAQKAALPQTVPTVKGNCPQASPMVQTGQSGRSGLSGNVRHSHTGRQSQLKPTNCIAHPCLHCLPAQPPHAHCQHKGVQKHAQSGRLQINHALGYSIAQWPSLQVHPYNRAIALSYGRHGTCTRTMQPKWCDG